MPKLISPTSVKQSLATAKAKLDRKHLIIDGVDWTLTEARFRRREALGQVAFFLVWLVVVAAFTVALGTWTEGDTAFFAGAAAGMFLGFRDAFRSGKMFGRVFQRETNSEQTIEVPAEPKAKHIYRATPKTR